MMSLLIGSVPVVAGFLLGGALAPKDNRIGGQLAGVAGGLAVSFALADMRKAQAMASPLGGPKAAGPIWHNARPAR